VSRGGRCVGDWVFSALSLVEEAELGREINSVFNYFHALIAGLWGFRFDSFQGVKCSIVLQGVECVFQLVVLFGSGGGAKLFW